MSNISNAVVGERLLHLVHHLSNMNIIHTSSGAATKIVKGIQRTGQN